MNNLQPGTMELVLRAHFASLQLEAERIRLGKSDGQPQASSRRSRGRRIAALRGLRALRSLGIRAVPALGR